MKYIRIPMVGDTIVVAFDMCSSSDIIEELTLKGDISRFQDFLTKMKHYLAASQKKVPFDPYKFTGDGWILLFPPNTNGPALLDFLKKLCVFYRREFRKDVLRYLDTPPSITGLTMGVSKGPIVPMIIYGTKEYVGRALNISCRLQKAVKDKDGSPGYKALVTNAVYNDYFSPAKGYKVISATRSLLNIRGGAKFRCKKFYF